MAMKLKILHWFCRIVLGGIFLYTGYIKLGRLGAVDLGPIHFEVGDIWNRVLFAQSIAGYQLVPDAWVPFIATWFPWLELLLGVLLLVGWRIRWVAGASAALLLFFTAIMSITYFRGIDANCGCFSFTDKISPWSILRDSVILLPALYLVFEPSLRRRFLNRPDAAAPSTALSNGVQEGAQTP
ncbi:MAG: DoxX family membrane protein [Acidobacteriota bacterium]|nr:DoxX family membrane protein [Acidobacteriota bacterium]